jgi:hypothetical protein
MKDSGVVLTLFNGHLHYPNDTDRSLYQDDTDKIRKYRVDNNNNPPNGISFMSVIDSTSGRLHSHFVCLLTNSGLFHYFRSVFSSQLKSKCGNILVVTLRIILSIDGVPVGQDHTLTHRTRKPLVH